MHRPAVFRSFRAHRYTLDSRLVRGLDYYSETAFEFVMRDPTAAHTAVLAGGRYDGLGASLGGSAVPAVGWALGVDRIASLVDPALLPVAPPAVSCLSPSATPDSLFRVHVLCCRCSCSLSVMTGRRPRLRQLRQGRAISSFSQRAWCMSCGASASVPRCGRRRSSRSSFRKHRPRGLRP